MKTLWEKKSFLSKTVTGAPELMHLWNPTAHAENDKYARVFSALH